MRALRVQLAADSSREASAETIACDAVLMSVGFAPAAGLLAQSGATMQYDSALQQHLPVKLPPGIFAAGRVNGIYEYAAAPPGRPRRGRGSGRARARAVTKARAPRGPRARGRCRIRIPVFAHPRGREFVDLDEDIQIKDLLNSAQEGFDSTELMKRFSTLGMGPSQGKHSNLNGARILMRVARCRRSPTRH